MSVTVTDFHFAAALDYVGHWLIEVESDQGRNAYLFEMEQADHDSLLAERGIA